MKQFHGLVALLGMALLASCETTAPPVPPADVRITLERGPCYGACPIYSVTITGDGQVTYRGVNFVHATGEQHGTASREDVAHLVSMLEAAHFFDLQEAYRANITDLPTYRVTYQRGPRTKIVADYAGGMVGMPHAVSEIEAEIDRVAHTDQWVARQPGDDNAPKAQ